MKQFLSVVALSLFVSSASFASFPVKSSSNVNENVAVATNKKTKKQSTVFVKENSEVKTTGNAEVKNVDKVQTKLDKKATKGDNTTTAIILAVISVLLLPFGLHNWYLGRKKQALWQTLLVFPGIILLIPPVISWIWQIVDLVRLIANGELPN